MKSEPVVTIPAALALVANAVLGLLVKMGVIPDELTAEIVGVVNGLVVLAGLLLARSQVTPVARADALVEAASIRAHDDGFAEGRRMAKRPGSTGAVPTTASVRKRQPRPKA